MDDELPSVAMTMRFLALCHLFGSQQAAVGAIATGRKNGLAGLPQQDDWMAWNADEMGAAVKYLENSRCASAHSPGMDPESVD